MHPFPPDYLPLEIAIQPKSRADQERLAAALGRLAAEDPLFRVSVDHESGLTRMSGVDESHLNAKIDILRRIYKVEASIGAPMAAYRETLGVAREIDYTHKRQTGSTGQFARVKILFEPTGRGEGETFVSAIVGGSVPDEFIPGVERGIRSVANSGPLVGFPIIDFKATLLDGAYHDVDSSALAFEIAARAAFREASQKAQMKLLEPIMTVEIRTPEDFVGTVIGDLNSRRGKVLGQVIWPDAVAITAIVPLSNLFGFETALLRHTQGLATYAMTLAGLQEIETRGGGGDDTFPPAIGKRA